MTPDRSNSELRMVFVLTTEEEARSFVIASADIEALPGTKGVRIVDWAEVNGMEPAPPWRHGHPSPDSPWVLCGVVIGPDATEVPDGNLPAMETGWAQAVLDILEAYGLPKPDAEDEEVCH